MRWAARAAAAGWCLCCSDQESSSQNAAIHICNEAGALTCSSLKTQFDRPQAEPCEQRAVTRSAPVRQREGTEMETAHPRARVSIRAGVILTLEAVLERVADVKLCAAPDLVDLVGRELVDVAPSAAGHVAHTEKVVAVAWGRVLL